MAVSVYTHTDILTRSYISCYSWIVYKMRPPTDGSSVESALQRHTSADISRAYVLVNVPTYISWQTFCALTYRSLYFVTFSYSWLTDLAGRRHSCTHLRFRGTQILNTRRQSDISRFQRTNSVRLNSCRQNMRTVTWYVEFVFDGLGNSCM